MKDAEGIQVESLFPTVQEYFKEGKIEDPKHIKDSPVFIFFGKKDTMLAPGVTDKANAFY